MALQVATVACGLLVPALAVMGLMFAAVWAGILLMAPRRAAPVCARRAAGAGGGPRGGPEVRRRRTARSAVAGRRGGRRYAARVTERTLVLVKPDGVGRKLIGEVLSRIERKGLDIVALELRTVERELAEQHYAEHDGKPFFESLLEFITSGKVLAAVVEGPRAIAAFRQLAGGTDPVEKATPGTIRGDFGLETQFNLVHGSDSPESAAREIKLWFPNL